MVSICKRIMEKIRKAENKVKNFQYALLCKAGDTRQKSIAPVKKDPELIEDIRCLKENITEERINSGTMAYQSITVRNSGCKHL